MSLTDVLFGCILRHRTETNHILVIHRCRHHVQFCRCIDGAQQFLVQFVRALQTETHQSQLKIVSV